ALPREGFPPIQFPIGFINVSYLVDDVESVDQDLVAAVTPVLSENTQINSFSSSTTPNSANLVLEFDSGVDEKEAIVEVKQAIESQVKLPSAAQISYFTLQIDKFAGEYDVLISISNENSDQLKTDAAYIANELSRLNSVAEAEVIELFEERIDVQTGDT